MAPRAEAARNDETQTAIKESKHAQDMIYNAHRLAKLKTGIAGVHHHELACAERLQHGAEGIAATYRAQAEADAVASAISQIKPQHSHASMQKSCAVASLGGDLRRRDAEVAALCDQMNIERRLIS